MTALATERLRESIVYGDIKMGAPLQEKALSEELGISRTPIREALFKLQAEGLVTIRPYRGASVFTVTPEQLQDLVDFRGLLEIAALRKTMAERRKVLSQALENILVQMKNAVVSDDVRQYLLLDHNFHIALIESSGSQCLMDGYGLIASKMTALRTALGQTRERIVSSYGDHEKFYTLFEAGDDAAACDVLSNHIQIGTVLFSSNPGVVIDQKTKLRIS